MIVNYTKPTQKRYLLDLLEMEAIIIITVNEFNAATNVSQV